MDQLASRAAELLEEIHENMFSRAKKLRDTHLISITNWDEFIPALDAKNLVLAPWCEAVECEEDIRVRPAEGPDGTKVLAAKSLCIPFEQEPLPEAAVCFGCGKPAVSWTMFGRSY